MFGAPQTHTHVHQAKRAPPQGRAKAKWASGGVIQRVTNLRLLDYAITVNVDPLPVTREINKEEREHDRIAGDYASEKKISLLSVMEKKAKKIHALMQGQIIPFHALFVVRAWDKTQDGLNAKVGAIKNAINSMNSGQYFEPNLPSTIDTHPNWRRRLPAPSREAASATTTPPSPVRRRRRASAIRVSAFPRARGTAARSATGRPSARLRRCATTARRASRAT